LLPQCSASPQSNDHGQVGPGLKPWTSLSCILRNFVPVMKVNKHMSKVQRLLHGRVAANGHSHEPYHLPLLVKVNEILVLILKFLVTN
jgi:hypothetical protein